MSDSKVTKTATADHPSYAVMVAAAIKERVAWARVGVAGKALNEVSVCVGIEGGARVGVDGKALYDVSVGVGVEGGAVTVVSDLLKKDFTDNCLCILMVL